MFRNLTLFLCFLFFLSSNPKANELTNDEINTLYSQLIKCHNNRAGTIIEEGTFVKISAEFDRNAIIIRDSIRLVDTNLSGKNVMDEIIIESAVATFFNSDCIPLNVPLDKYNSWKKLIINFDFDSMSK